MTYTSDRKCTHGISYDVPCVDCEKYGLIEKIGWMKPIVAKAEKRLEEIRRKQNKPQTKDEVLRRNHSKLLENNGHGY